VVLFYHLTTHVEGDKDQELLGFLSDRVAFPTVLYLTPDGSLLHKHVGDRSVRSFDREIHGYYQLRLARKDLASGNLVAAILILETELKLGLLKYTSANKRYRKLPADQLKKRPERDAEIRQQLVCLEAKQVYFGVVKGKTSADRDYNRAKQAHAMLTAGRIPKDESTWRFWKLLMIHAEQTKSLKLFDRASGEYQALRKDRLSDDDRQRIQRRRARLSGQL
jgi:hypothetical protein